LDPDLAITDTQLDVLFEGDLSNVRIHYALGIYNETGLNSVSDTYLTLDGEGAPLRRDDAEDESFLQFAYSADTPDSIVLSNSEFDEADSGAFVESGSLSQILSRAETVPDIGEGEAEVVFLLVPGAFLVECVAEGASEEGQFVAAASVFPNLIVFDGEDYPVLSVAGDTVDFSLPDEYSGAQINLIAHVRDVGDPPLSEEPATDRWLQLLSISEPEPGETDTVVQAAGIVGESGSLNGLDYSGQFEAGKTYNIVMFFLLNEFMAVRSAIFDADIDESGEATFTAFDEFITTEKPSRYRTPTITDSRQTIEVSTRGLREVLIEGTALHKVKSVKIGSLDAKIVSTEEASLIVQLPKLATGVYDLAMTHNRGEVIQKGLIKIVASKKLTQIIVASSVRKAGWLPRLASSLTANKSVVQVDCVARVPRGLKTVALKKKAAAICAQVTDDSIKTRVLVNKTPAGSTASVAIKLWD
jgi:hypothetical protein